MEFTMSVVGKTTSTNDEIKKAIDEGKPEGTAVRALKQSAGRGRNGRTWKSPAGSLYLSVLLRPQVPAEQLPSLSLIAGLALNRMFASYYESNGKEMRLKWPNDVMVTKPQNGKLAGILLETHDGAVILGVGLNMNRPFSATDIDPQACYLTEVAGLRRMDPEAYGGEFLRQFDELYTQWLAEGFAPFADEFNEAALFSDRTIELLDANGGVIARGVATGVDANGFLLVRDADGAEHAVASGEVHVVG